MQEAGNGFYKFSGGSGEMGPLSIRSSDFIDAFTGQLTIR